MGNSNVGHKLNVTEEVADPMMIPYEILDRVLSAVYNPAIERQSRAYFASAVPLRHISKGEEILENYLGMASTNMKEWAASVIDLKYQCAAKHGERLELS